MPNVAANAHVYAAAAQHLISLQLHLLVTAAGMRLRREKVLISMGGTCMMAQAMDGKQYMIQRYMFVLRYLCKLMPRDRLYYEVRHLSMACCSC
jgi:hypothetical protein